ncbi:hypothetical protein D3C81_1937060 [compost metagenome]
MLSPVEFVSNSNVTRGCLRNLGLFMSKIYDIIDANGRPIIPGPGLTGGKIADFFPAAGSLLVQKKAGTLLPTKSTIPMAI